MMSVSVKSRVRNGWTSVKFAGPPMFNIRIAVLTLSIWMEDVDKHRMAIEAKPRDDDELRRLCDDDLDDPLAE